MPSASEAPSRDGDQALARRHDLAHRGVEPGLEAQVAVGDDADHRLALDHREARRRHAARDSAMTSRTVWSGRHRDRVAQHAGLVALDARHLGRLLLRREVLVHDADAAFLGDGDRQAGLGDGVHRRRHQRQVERDVAGEAGWRGWCRAATPGRTPAPTTHRRR